MPSSILSPGNSRSGCPERAFTIIGIRALGRPHSYPCPGPLNPIFAFLPRLTPNLFRLSPRPTSSDKSGHQMADHAHQYSTKICGVQRCGMHEREERNLDWAELSRSETQLHWREFLGARVFCLDGGAGGRDGSRIHSMSRTASPAPGAAEHGVGGSRLQAARDRPL